ncbi:hypothetical protein B0F90DRAFT_287161 [Multifurca ochricompacta]|uniref:Alpha/beta hydrolase fold-3 domain-containing protein n=1 Tax=Multifurca ochricompacta TaxID=376703 RepID=A0AAD4M530_9AGAM|nr:hypothetical protein B0F90DRAFT_287161 [Multifurca ochricompacta]
MQGFTSIRTPAQPSSHVVKLYVPRSCCAEAARVLVEVCGGEREAKRVFGGIKWWQVRAAGDEGVDAEWMMDKKDWKELKRREKTPPAISSTPTSPEMSSGSSSASPRLPPPVGEDEKSADDADVYHPEMDEMRCMLWVHGGGYVSGSVDQERYMIQRFARKIHGRVFAPNYRLAPQYPFPCALQDVLASYLFLIRPPEGAAHRPVHPSNIVIGGDSAGGGLAIALLQVIRDSGLPAPAGAVLVSPWCDLLHSFPSVFLNKETDVLPETGLAIFKPSSVWPPPPDDVRRKVHDLLRSNAVREREPAVVHSKSPSDASTTDQPDDDNIQPRVELIPHSVMASTAVEADETVLVNGEDGKSFKIARQIQLYTTNGLLKHPMVSPALAYLGGLPPLFVIASEKEVLRDEIIYTAHRAAHPEKYAISEEVKKLYPAYEGIENRMKPTTVHLQVYDDTAHVIPLMFGATTPAKYCYRAIATFMKHVTNMPPTIALQKCKTPPARTSTVLSEEMVIYPVSDVPSPPLGSQAPANLHERSPSSPRPKSLSRISRSFRQRISLFSESSQANSDFSRAQDGLTTEEDTLLAGDPIVYHGGWVKSPEHQGMIRERVAINGSIRPLESEEDIPALQLPPEQLGTVSEYFAWIYLEFSERQEKKFAAKMRNVAKHRERALSKAQPRHGNTRDMGDRDREGINSVDGVDGEKDAKDAAFGGWEEDLDWTLDANERPPPSSIVAAAEALKLARARGGGANSKRRHSRRGSTNKSSGDAAAPEKRQKKEGRGRERERGETTFWSRRNLRGLPREQGLSVDVGVVDGSVGGAVPVPVQVAVAA